MEKQLELYDVQAGSEKGKCKVFLRLRDEEKGKFVAVVTCHTNYMESIQKAFSRMIPVKFEVKEEPPIKVKREKRG